MTDLRFCIYASAIFNAICIVVAIPGHYFAAAFVPVFTVMLVVSVRQWQRGMGA